MRTPACARTPSRVCVKTREELHRLGWVLSSVAEVPHQQRVKARAVN